MINTLQNEIAQLKAQQSYTDLNSLQNIRKNGVENKDLALRQVAQQFESMFVQMMLKSMRSANDVFGKDNPLNSFEMKHHQEMYDSQLSLSLSQSNNLGLADAFYRQMKANYLPSEGKVDADNAIDKRVFPDTVSNQYLRKSSNKNSLNNEEVLLKGIESPEDFVQLLTPHAKKAAKSLGVDYRFLIAQSALETGWGKHIIKDQYGKQSFNLFNIKADSRWEGKSINVPTIEYVNGIAEKEKANFRRYNSIEESFVDYQKFLQQPRYADALASANTPDFVNQLQYAGYATDPRYAEKIQKIVNTLLPNELARN